MNYSRFSATLTRAVSAAAMVATACLAGMWVASTTHSVISPFWPASGVAVGVVLLWGWPALAGVCAGVIASNAYSGLPSIFTVVGAMAFAGEAALGAGIVRLVRGKNTRLDDLRGILAIVVGAAWLPPFLNAMLCGRFLPVADHAPFLSGREDVVRFVLANGFGIALVAPVMLVWQRTTTEDWRWKISAALAATALTVFLCFGRDFPLTLLLVPVIGAAIATDLRGASLTCAVTATAMVVLSGAGFGSLVGSTGTDYARVYAMFAVMAFGVLPIGAASGEYKRLLRQRRAAEQAAGLRFWEWNDVDGLQFGEGADAPAELFHAARERGSLEVRFGDGEALSFWQTVSRRPDGRPREVAGMLIDATDRMQSERTRRKAWESEVELRNLRASLTPHLLFNCLAAVRGIVRTEPEKARIFIDALARFLRDSIDAQTRETVPLHEEWHLCEAFLDLQSLRYERDLPRFAEIDGPAQHAQIPPMMLLNLVENAVKHGEVTQLHPLKVRISLRDGALGAEVRNHGRFQPALQERHGGVAVANARLQVLYGDRAFLAMRQDGEEVVAEMRLPAFAPRPGPDLP